MLRFFTKVEHLVETQCSKCLTKLSNVVIIKQYKQTVGDKLERSKEKQLGETAKVLDICVVG